ncbi:MAG: archease [candidate division Zixibacteria bacterium]|nr:archease [candidate division Zixibacteria bacterium]
MGEFKVVEEGAFGDFEFEAKADTLEKLFETCGLATFEAMTDVSRVEAIVEIHFDVSAESLEELLYAFLAELIYVKDVDSVFISKYDISLQENYDLSCKAWGEIIDSEKHNLRTDVKAVTYHKLEIKKSNGGYSAHVILDL